MILDDLGSRPLTDLTPRNSRPHRFEFNVPTSSKSRMPFYLEPKDGMKLESQSRRRSKYLASELLPDVGKEGEADVILFETDDEQNVLIN